MSDLFASPGTLAAGAFTGLVFGFLLQRGGVTRFTTIVDQFLLRDFTVLKVMLTAIVVGGLGLVGMRALGMEVPAHIKTAQLLANGAGGVIFGVGMAILGYCPGTAVAALGDGSRHAWAGVAGMLAGAAVYAETEAAVTGRLAQIGDLGKATFDAMTGISPFWLLLALAIVGAAFFVWLERHDRPHGGAVGG